MPLKNANILAKKATTPENLEPPTETPEASLTPPVPVADQEGQTGVPVGGEAVGTPVQPTVLEAEAIAGQPEAQPELQAQPKPEAQPTKERKRAKP
jgi:hypothetical protein